MSAYGITSLMDAFVTPTEMKVWRLLHDSGKLPMRVRMAMYVADPNDDSDDALERRVRASREGNIDPEFLRSGVVKVFADGVMEYPAQTAALLSPYLDGDGKPTDKAGNLYFEPERFARLVQKLARPVLPSISMPSGTAPYARASMPLLPHARQMATRTTATRSRICNSLTLPTFSALRSSA